MTTEHRLMIDIQETREASHQKGIANIGWMDRYRNKADALSKTAKSKARLNFLHTHRLKYVPLPWVLQNGSGNVDWKHQGRSISQVESIAMKTHALCALYSRRQNSTPPRLPTAELAGNGNIQ